MNIEVDIHADDFGESVHASQDILECLKKGKLNSISVIPNMGCFQECISLYRNAQNEFECEPLISVHINIMEGKCLAEIEEVPRLVNSCGYFSVSWEKLFIMSWCPGRAELKKQLKREIYLQIKKIKQAFPEKEYLRIDSHQHTHMIPVVADALFEVLEENNWEISYIRNAKEPISPFLRELSLYKTYRTVNFVKNILLNFCSMKMEKYLANMEVYPMYLWGLVMSGYMDEERVKILLEKMEVKAEKNGRKLEILFHPGRVLREEINEEFSQKKAIDFYLSYDREVERKTVCNLEIKGRCKK